MKAKPIEIDLDSFDFDPDDRKAMLKAWKELPEGNRPTWEAFKRFVPTALWMRRADKKFRDGLGVGILSKSGRKVKRHVCLPDKTT